MAERIQKRRLLRMTVAHHRQQHVSEEDFHRWVTEQHAARAAKLHAKNGIEGFSIVSTCTLSDIAPSTLLKPATENHDFCSTFLRGPSET